MTPSYPATPEQFFFFIYVFPSSASLATSLATSLAASPAVEEDEEEEEEDGSDRVRLALL